MNELSLGHGFSFERAFLVLRNRVVEEASTLGVGLAVIVGINALGYLFSRRFFFNQSGGNLWAIAIFLSGIFLAAQAFKGMHDGKSGTDWLLLPATPLEKYTAAVVDYVLLFPIAASLAAAALSALFSLIESTTGRAGYIWTPWNLSALRAYGQYAVVALLFITGSASFRKGAFLKTCAMVVAYALVLSLVFGGGAWIVAKARGIGSSNFSFINGSFNVNSDTIPASAREAVGWIGKMAWYAVLPIFSLIYGYFRVFEKEARDEVQ